MVTYQDKLKDPRWQRKRLEIFQRDDWKCTRCNCSTKTLHVHHARYVDDLEPWEYPNELLATLCEPCHSREHGVGGELVESVAKMLAVFHVQRERLQRVRYQEPGPSEIAKANARKQEIMEVLEAHRA